MSSSTEVIRVEEMAPRIQFSADQVDLIKRTIAKGATNDELRLFLGICERSGLDPFARQIYCMKRWEDGKEKMSAEVSIDGLRLCAERSGKYAGQVGPEWCGSDGLWIDIWLDDDPPTAARVGILRHDFKEVLWGKALYSEYIQRKKDGTPNTMWKTRAAGQLAKCAEALGLRKAFPRELSGLYSREEMAQSHAEDQGQQDSGIDARSDVRDVPDGGTKGREVGQTTSESVRPDVKSPEQTDWKFPLLKAFAAVKSDLKKLAGNDKRYYEVLGAAGYEKSDQIKTREEGVVIFKLMKQAFEDLYARAQNLGAPLPFTATDEDLPEVLQGKEYPD